jgi:hypothetical protein
LACAFDVVKKRIDPVASPTIADGLKLAGNATASIPAPHPF